MFRLVRPGAAAVLAAILVIGVGVFPVAARQDPGPISVTAVSLFCPLTRVGNQLVRCDSLTGIGAPAPTWVPES